MNIQYDPFTFNYNDHCASSGLKPKAQTLTDVGVWIVKTSSGQSPELWKDQKRLSSDIDSGMNRVGFLKVKPIGDLLNAGKLG